MRLRYRASANIYRQAYLDSYHIAMKMQRDRHGAIRKRQVDIPRFQSIRHMSDVTGIPEPLMKKAQAAGCSFRDDHGRCDLIVFLQWWFQQDIKETEKKEDWDVRNKRAQALIREVDLDERNKEVIEFKKVSRFISRLTSVAFFGELARLRSEFPASLKGKGELDIARECDREIKLIKENIEKQLLLFEQLKGDL